MSDTRRLAHILVPTDFSPPSQTALACAATIGGAFGATLHVLHVLENVVLRPAVGDLYALEAAALTRVRDLLPEQERQRLHVTPVVARSDDAPDAIVRHAAACSADLVVMGTHGRSGLAQMLVGSVAASVVRAAPCPVLTVHAGARLSPGGFARVLAATDFSAHSDAALDCARLFAARFDASLHLLHVIDERPVDREPGTDMFDRDAPDTRSARLEDARERLQHRISPDDRVRLRAATEVIVGPCADTIVHYAADNGFDLIVMGTHGRTGMARLLMGSVAEQVVRAATCPVLTTSYRPGDVDEEVLGDDERAIA